MCDRLSHFPPSCQKKRYVVGRGRGIILIKDYAYLKKENNDVHR